MAYMKNEFHRKKDNSGLKYDSVQSLTIHLLFPQYNLQQGDSLHIWKLPISNTGIKDTIAFLLEIPVNTQLQTPTLCILVHPIVIISQGVIMSKLGFFLMISKIGGVGGEISFQL